MDKKITIIGGSGFVGTNLCKHLKKLDIPFEILDLKKSSTFPEQTTVVDIRDKNSLKRKISGSVVVHLAAVHSDNIKDKKSYFNTNVEGTRNIINECKSSNVRKIIFTSSVAVYGFAPPETSENGEIRPFNEYGTTKFLAEEELRKWYLKDKTNLSLLIIRPTVIFGEGNRGNVYNLLSQIESKRFLMIGNGENKKSIAYVGNFVPFLYLCIVKKLSFGVFNYVDKPDMSMNNFVQHTKRCLNLGDKVGLRIPFILGMLIGKIADIYAFSLKKKTVISSIRIQKFCATSSFKSNKSDLGSFSPPFSLKSALRRTIKYEFLENNHDKEIFFTE